MQELSVTALTGLNPYETEWPTCAGADRCLLSDLEGKLALKACTLP